MELETHISENIKNPDYENDAENKKKSKTEKRRRSSFSAKRQSILTPFIDTTEQQLEQREDKENTEQEGSCPDSASEDPVHVSFAAEITRFNEESKDWEQCLMNSEKTTSQAQQNLSTLVPILDEDVAMVTKMAASCLIGQAPDYSNILANLFTQTNSAFSKLDEICLVTELMDGVVQKTNTLLEGYSDQLGEVSIPSMDTPRTQIRQRLNIGTPR